MQLGIMAKTFTRPTLEGVLDAVMGHGLHCVQFNFTCAGLPTMPEEIEPACLAKIRKELDAREIKVAAVSGTFNMIHPDPKKRRGGFNRLPLLAHGPRKIWATLVNLLTGPPRA